MKDDPRTEQQFLAEFFKGKTDGFFVEIGDHDGISYSNTRDLWFVGWSGILIEPDPDTFQMLQRNYNVKNRLEFINAAICDKNGPMDFYQHSDPQRTGWHSMCPEWIATWEPGASKKITVQGIRFDTLKLPSHVDFLSVDTEGMDAEILEGLPELFRPDLIMCEVDKAGVRGRVEKEMFRRNYKFVWGTYLNSAYASH